MPVRRRELRDAPRRSAGNGQHIDQRAALLLRLIADDELRAVGRDAVVVVAAYGKAGVDRLRFAAADRQLVDAPALVEQKVFSVARPVGRFEGRAVGVDNAAIFGRNRNGLQRAFENRLRALLDLDVRKKSLLDDVVVVRADAEADIERLGQFDPERAARRLQRFVFAGDRHEDVIAAFLDLNAARRLHVRLNLARRAALYFSVLQRGQAVAVQRRVGVGRIRVETLTDDQTGFAMRIAAGADELNVGGD